MGALTEDTGVIPPGRNLPQGEWVGCFLERLRFPWERSRPEPFSLSIRCHLVRWGAKPLVTKVVVIFASGNAIHGRGRVLDCQPNTPSWDRCARCRRRWRAIPELFLPTNIPFALPISRCQFRHRDCARRSRFGAIQSLGNCRTYPCQKWLLCIRPWNNLIRTS